MVNAAIDTKRIEALGPAERAIVTLTQYIDHLVHNRTGVVVRDPTTPVGVAWTPAIWKEEGEDAAKVKKVFTTTKIGNTVTKTEIGTLSDNGKVMQGRTEKGEFREAGLFPEVVGFVYQSIANIFAADNEFAARWASWAFEQDHRDLKVVLAAFMLVQNRYGAPVFEDANRTKVLFRDDDFRTVGEAMLLSSKDKLDFSAKMVLRVGEVLDLQVIRDINRKLGFGTSNRSIVGRYHDAVEKWLRYREENPKMLTGLAKAGFRTTVMALAQRIGYKPTSAKFFEVLRWKQKQSKLHASRELVIGKDVAAAESWEGLSETEICERITKSKPNYKRIMGMLPSSVGLTRAVVAAAIEAGCCSTTDLVIMTPTLEDLGLLKVDFIKAKWDAALKLTEDRRAANIATRVKDEGTKDQLVAAADDAAKAAVEKVTKDMIVYLIVDKSSSMSLGMDRAKSVASMLVRSIPADRLHVSVFNSIGTKLTIPHPSAAGVEQAFKGHTAGGMTSHLDGVRVMLPFKPKNGEDVLFIFVGDQEDNISADFLDMLKQFNPMALGMLQIGHVDQRFRIIEKAAVHLGIPLIPIEEKLFSDPYAAVRVLRNLIASTPVGKSAMPSYAVPKRESLIETILKTPLLPLPVWAVKVREAAAA